MTEIKATNVVWHEGHVDRKDREKLLSQKGCTIWLTGLPSSGKSTIGFSLEHSLVAAGRMAYVLDGDNIRHGMNAGGKILMDTCGYSDTAAKRFGLAFSAEDRAENIRRIGEVAKLFADASVITITSFVSPYRADRDLVRKLHDEAKVPFVEVFVDTPVDECEKRDPKGLYKKARAGEIKNFTGVSDPYEAPTKPEVILKTAEHPLEACVAQLAGYLSKHGIL